MVVQCPFYAIEEHRFVIGYWEAVWLGRENMVTRSTRSWGGNDMLGVIGQWSKVLCWGMSRFLCGDQRVFMAQGATFLFRTFAGGTVLAGVGSFSRSLSFSTTLRLRLRGRD